MMENRTRRMVGCLLSVVLVCLMLFVATVMSFSALAQEENETTDVPVPADFGGALLGSFLCCGLLLLPLVIGLLIGIWVYKDAESRGMNGVLWLIVVLIGSIIGLIIYFVVREPKKKGSKRKPAKKKPKKKPAKKKKKKK